MCVLCRVMVVVVAIAPQVHLAVLLPPGPAHLAAFTATGRWQQQHRWACLTVG